MTSGRRSKARRRHDRETNTTKNNAQHGATVTNWDGSTADDLGVLTGWAASDAERQRVRELTHDKLVAMLGAQRSGGVVWRESTGSRALELIDELDVDVSPELADYYNELRAVVRLHGGILVVAFAPVRRST